MADRKTADNDVVDPPSGCNLSDMNRNERGLEFKVGVFVFVGLAMLAALVVQFGRLGEGFKTYYHITVRFSDASGLLKGSDILLAGAKIGKVSDGPHMVREGNGVDVPLKIYDYIKVPDGSKFTVGSSGLLGDRFVNVTLPPGQPKQFIALVGDLRAAVAKIDGTVARLDQEALSQANIDNLKASMAHLNEATGSLAESSKKLNGVVDKADSTMDSAKKAADDLQETILEARKVFQSATQGKGLLAALLTNQDLANDLRALVANLRAHGVLFYRDTAAKIDMNQPNKPPRQPGGR